MLPEQKLSQMTCSIFIIDLKNSCFIRWKSSVIFIPEIASEIKEKENKINVYNSYNVQRRYDMNLKYTKSTKLSWVKKGKWDRGNKDTLWMYLVRKVVVQENNTPATVSWFCYLLSVYLLSVYLLSVFKSHMFSILIFFYL